MRPTPARIAAKTARRRSTLPRNTANPSAAPARPSTETPGIVGPPRKRAAGKPAPRDLREGARDELRLRRRDVEGGALELRLERDDRNAEPERLQQDRPQAHGLRGDNVPEAPCPRRQGGSEAPEEERHLVHEQLARRANGANPGEHVPRGPAEDEEQHGGQREQIEDEDEVPRGADRRGACGPTTPRTTRTRGGTGNPGTRSGTARARPRSWRSLPVPVIADAVGDEVVPLHRGSVPRPRVDQRRPRRATEARIDGGDDDGDVRDHSALNRLDDGQPVREGGRADGDALRLVRTVRPDVVDELASRGLVSGHVLPRGRRARRLGGDLSRRKRLEQMNRDLYGFLDFADADFNAAEDVGGLGRHHPEGDVPVGGVRVVPPDVEVHAAPAGGGPDRAQGDGPGLG